MDGDSQISNISQYSASNQKITINGWTENHEEIFYEWADKAMCYRWLHSRSFNIYSWKAAAYTIPVIIMSTITGTANFAQDKFPEQYRTMAQMTIGAINIIAGILTTIQQYFKINELNEAHRVSSISWGKFHQNIKVEMTKHPKDRKPPMDMLNAYKEEFDRLLEISPNIEDAVVLEFKNKFDKKSKKEALDSKIIKEKYNKQLLDLITSVKNDDKNDVFDKLTTNDNEDNLFTSLDNVLNNYISDTDKMKKQKAKNKFSYLKKPDICDELISISENKRSWYNVSLKKNEIVSTADDNVEAIEIAEKRKEKEIYKNQLESFIKEYKNIKGQYPLVEDIIDNKKDSIPLHIIREISDTLLKNIYDNIDNV